MNRTDLDFLLEIAFRAGWDEKESQLRDLFQGSAMSYEEGWKDFLKSRRLQEALLRIGVITL